MQARYLPWAIVGGACVTLAPGSPFWLVPLVGALVHMGYDIDPEGWQETGQRLITTVRRAELPERVRSSPLVQRKPQSEQTPAHVKQTPDRDPLLLTLEQEPHRLIIGRSRGGKTTLMHELATNWASAGERVMVIDPDAAPGQWPGCRVVGGSNDLEAAARMLDLTAQEFHRREERRNQGQRTFAPLHLVIDEAHAVLPDIENGIEVFEDVTRRGAKYNMHLTIGVQDKQVATLGLAGKSKLLTNFIVADVMKSHDGARKAVIRDAVTGKDTAYPIPQLRDPETLIAAHPAVQTSIKPVTKAAPVATFEAGALLTGLLKEAAPASSTMASQSHHITQEAGGMGGMNDTLHTTHTTHTDASHVTIHNEIVTTRPTPRPRTRGKGVNMEAMRRRRVQRQRDARYEQVKEMVRGGMSGNKIRVELGADRKVIQDLVRRAKAELSIQ